MLTEQRFERILERLKVKKSITVAEITEDLGISESTARRDITALDKAGEADESVWRSGCCRAYL